MTKISTDPPAFRVRPAQPEEAGAFFAQTPEQNAQMGAIGCVRMDFGKRGTAFWHTWHPRGREELNSPEFRAELQQVVDTLRETVLKDLSSMRHFCYENGGKIPGGWSQNYGYVVETEHYEYCLRCNPVPGDYQAYLSCYDLNEQKINHAYQPLVGRIHFINGDAQQFTDAKAYLDCVREELPHEATTGFRFRTITQDPTIRKAVDDNIAVIEQDGRYDYCPFFDQGAGLLSNTQFSPMDITPEALIRDLRARPFGTSFNRQMHTAQTLYGRQLQIQRFRREELMEMLRPLLECYAPRDRGLIADRVCAAVLLRQKEL